MGNDNTTGALEIAVLKEAVEELAEQMAGTSTVVGLVKMMDAVHNFTESLGAVKSEAQKLYDRVRFTLLPEAMAADDITNITVDGVGRCYLTDDVGVTSPDKQLLIDWLVSNELEDLVTETVNASTLAAFVRRSIKEGRQLPIEVFTVRPFTRAAITSK